MIIQEKAERIIEFDFDDESWYYAIKYDESDEHERIEVMDGSKAIDIIAKHKSNSFIFIEIKDFKGHRISTKERLNPKGKDPIEKELSLKLRNTLPGIISGARNKGENQTNYAELLSSLSNTEKDIRFILWLERDLERTGNRKKVRVRKDPLLQSIKKELAWLNVKIRIANSHDYPFKESLSISFLPNP